jgi:23S rRNA pseudouridine1911/1915/1917 synthase
MSPLVDILYENGPCFVFNKPSGLLTQSAGGIDSLENRVRAFLTERDQPPYPLYLGTIHRLDRPVTGAIVMATRLRATQKLSKQFERRTIDKRYWAIVEGEIDPDEGEWIDHIRKIPNEAHAEIVPPDHPEGRKAVLSYRTLDRREGVSLLEIDLHTGRMHQIRVQAASRGFPIIGDEQYGSTQTLGETQEDRRMRPIALHARTLSFDDPSSKERITVSAPLPNTWLPWSFTEPR